MKQRTMTELEYTQAKVVGATALMVAMLAEITVRKENGLPYAEILSKLSGGIGGLEENCSQLRVAVQKLTLE